MAGALLVVILAAWMVYGSKSLPDRGEGGVQVTASIYPLAFIAERIGGNRVRVASVVPSGVEVHDFEPTARDLIGLLDSEVVVLSGLGLEPWADGVIGEINRSQAELVLAGENLPTVLTGKNASVDPHFWLNPVLLSQAADKVAGALIAADEAGQSYYEQNLSDLKLELRALDDEFKSGLADCAQRTFISSHAAFGYLADAYNLEQVAISGLEPDQEPSAGQLAEISDLVRNREIHYIFFENWSGSELAKILADEAGVATLVLNPLENLSPQDKAAGHDYLSEMKSNLSNLRIALECQVN